MPPPDRSEVWPGAPGPGAGAGVAPPSGASSGQPAGIPTAPSPQQVVSPAVPWPARLDRGLTVHVLDAWVSGSFHTGQVDPRPMRVLPCGRRGLCRRSVETRLDGLIGAAWGWRAWAGAGRGVARPTCFRCPDLLP